MATPQTQINTEHTDTLATEVIHAEGVTESGHELVHEVTIFAEPIFNLGGFQVTNALLTSWVVVLIIIALVTAVRLKIKKIPGKLQHLFEIMIDGGYALCDQVTNNRALSKRIFPLAFSIFMFVLISNWMGLLPIGAFGVDEHGMFVPFLRSGTADLNTTLALGLISVVGANLFGVMTIGAWKTFNKFFNFKALGKIFTDLKKDPTIVIVAPIHFFVGVLELIGEMAKIASLSFRLFGNVFAGEVLLLSMSLMLGYLLPIPFMFLEVMVGLIQAIIFSMLTVVYFTIAATDHDAHDEHAHEKHEDAHATPVLEEAHS